MIESSMFPTADNVAFNHPGFCLIWRWHFVRRLDKSDITSIRAAAVGGCIIQTGSLRARFAKSSATSLERARTGKGQGGLWFWESRPRQCRCAGLLLAASRDRRCRFCLQPAQPVAGLTNEDVFLPSSPVALPTRWRSGRTRGQHFTQTGNEPRAQHQHAQLRLWTAIYARRLVRSPIVTLVIHIAFRRDETGVANAAVHQQSLLITGKRGRKPHARLFQTGAYFVGDFSRKAHQRVSQFRESV